MRHSSTASAGQGRSHERFCRVTHTVDAWPEQFGVVHCSPCCFKHVFWRWPDGFRLDFSSNHFFGNRMYWTLILVPCDPFVFLKGTRMTMKSCSITRGTAVTEALPCWWPSSCHSLIRHPYVQPARYPSAGLIRCPKNACSGAPWWVLRVMWFQRSFCKVMLHFRTQMIYMTGRRPVWWWDPAHEGLRGTLLSEEISKTQSRNIPSWELTYPFPKHYWVDDVPFPKERRCIRSLEGIC